MLWLASAYSIVFAVKNKARYSTFITCAVTCTLTALLEMSFVLGYTGGRMVYSIFAVCVATAVVTLIYRLLPVKEGKVRSAYPINFFSYELIVLSEIGMYLSLYFGVGVVATVFSSVLALGAYVCFVLKKSNIAGFVSAFSLYAFVIYSAGEYGANSVLSSLILFTAGVLLGKLLHKRICEKTERGVLIDWLTIGAVLPALAVLFSGESYSLFAGLVALGVYALMYRKRIGGELSDRIMLSLSSGLLCASLWTQPFIEIPDVVSLELNYVPIFAFCLILWGIWIKLRKGIEIAGYVLTITAIVHMMIDILFGGLLLDSLILLGSMAVMLVVSFFIKKRRWFVLSVSVLVIATLFMTKEFWQSVVWWIYLLIVGILMIVIAALNELGKQKSSDSEDENSVKMKIKRFMSEWTW